MKKVELVRKVYDNAIIVQCAVMQDDLRVFPKDSEVLKDHEGDFYFTTEGRTSKIFLTAGEKFARIIVEDVGVGITTHTDYTERSVFYRGKEWTVEEFGNFLQKMDEDERQEFLQSEKPIKETQSIEIPIKIVGAKEAVEQIESLSEAAGKAGLNFEVVIHDEAREFEEEDLESVLAHLVGEDGSQACGGSENALTGFYPQKNQRLKWLKQLADNGVVEGSEVRLVEGQNAGHVVKFENIKFNDQGIYAAGNIQGYFIHERNGVVKAGKALYKIVGSEGLNKKKPKGIRVDLSNEVPEVFRMMFPKATSKYENKIVKGMIVETEGEVFAMIGYNDPAGELPMCVHPLKARTAKEVLTNQAYNVIGGLAYEFDDAKDLFTWLSID